MKKLTVLFLAVVVLSSVPVWAGDCLSCHQENGVTVRVSETPPLRFMVGDTLHELTLEQAFMFHGHECPGMTTTFLAFRYGLKILFGDEIPQSDDLLIVSRSPAGGIKDLIDLIMKGDNTALKSWAPDGMKNDQSRFDFILIRKSTAEMVEMGLKPGLFPEDFFRLKNKQKQQQSTPEEDDQLHEIIKRIITVFPTQPESELFGAPRPGKILLWGDVGEGEMDRHIRKMRQDKKAELRRQAAKEVK
ncbi:MAG: hypothetical protein JXQ81_09835 [Desulfuromonadales bacterium]|nr:hypothetical protein [Desulfuromonadales bacterium]